MTWTGDEALTALRKDAAAGLVAAAKLLADRHRRALGQQGPPASKPGQYPRRVTGALQAAVVVSPASAAEAERTLRLALGYDRGKAPHAAILERTRKGVADTVEAHKGELLAVVAGGGK